MSNLEKTLINFAEEFQTLLKDKVVSADMIASGALNNSIEVSSLYINNNEWKVILRGVDYLNVIEDGRKAGKQPPMKSILRWIELKGILPRADELGNDITNEQLAFLIGRKIGSRGIKGKQLISISLDELLVKYRPLIGEAILKDVELGIYTSMLEEFYGYKNVKINLK